MPAPRLPNRLSVSGPDAKFLRWLNELRDFVESQTHLQTNDDFLSTTTKGASRKSKVKPSASGGDAGVWL